MSNNGNPQQPKAVSPADLGPVQHQLVINFHAGGQVSFSHPTDFKIFSLMIGSLITNMPNLKFEAPSRIIQVPPGARVREPQG